MKDDVISRQMAIDAVDTIGHIATMPDGDKCIRKSAVKYTLSMLPAAQPEIIRCRDCRHWREHKYAKETKRYIPFCGFNAIYTKADDYCSKAEKRRGGDNT